MAADAAGAFLTLNPWLRAALLLLLQIRSGGGQQSPYYAELETAQSNAESSGLGLWSKVQPYGSFGLSYATSVCDCNVCSFSYMAGIHSGGVCDAG